MGYVRAEEPVTADWLAAQKFEIEIGWERYEAHAQSSAASRATLDALTDA